MEEEREAEEKRQGGGGEGGASAWSGIHSLQSILSFSPAFSASHCGGCLFGKFHFDVLFGRLFCL